MVSGCAGGTSRWGGFGCTWEARHRGMGCQHCSGNVPPHAVAQHPQVFACRQLQLLLVSSRGMVLGAAG